MELISFSKALEAVKGGQSVSRKRWEQDGIMLLLDDGVLKIRHKVGGVMMRWIAIQEDLLAEDWFLVEADKAQGTEVQ